MAKEARAEFIGSKRQRNDNDIAVVDAIRLSQCFIELRKKLIKPAQVPDRYPAYVEQERFTNISAAGLEALSKLQEEIEVGDLSVWWIYKAQEVKLNPRKLLPNSIKYGVFKTFERPFRRKDGSSKPPKMQGAFLWVKEKEWKRLLSSWTGPKTGRPLRYDWKKIEKAARKLVKDDPTISRNKLALMLSVEPMSARAGKLPHLTSIERYLRKWNLPPL